MSDWSGVYIGFIIVMVVCFALGVLVGAILF